MNTETQTRDLKEFKVEVGKILETNPCAEVLSPLHPLFNENGSVSDYYKSLSRGARKAIWIFRTHPSFTAAQLKSNERKTKRLEQEETLKQITDLSGARFLFYGRLTVCYERRKNTILISTSLRNPKDKDDRMEAKYCALYRLTEGQYIVVPTNKDVRTKAFVQDMFFSTVW